MNIPGTRKTCQKVLVSDVSSESSGLSWNAEKKNMKVKVQDSKLRS